MSKNKLSEDNKAKMLDKLREPASPIMTQVVRVDELVPPATSPAPADPLEQFNAKVPAELLRRARRYKADTRKTLNQITTEALAMYLDAVEPPASVPEPS